MSTPSSTAQIAPPTDRTRRRLSTLGIAMIVALLLQVVVGMADALWLDVPTTGNAWATSAPMILLNAHLLVGTAITLLALWMLVDAIRSRTRIWIISTIVGLLGVVAALGGGSAFLSTNGDPGSSFMMAIGCVVAIGAFIAPVVKR
jgi:heme A synthase